MASSFFTKPSKYHKEISEVKTMYLDSGALLAILIALVGALATTVLGILSARHWEQRYRDAIRLLKQERSARAYWDEHKETSR